MKVLQKLAFSVTVLAALSCLSSAQGLSTEKGQASDAVLVKMHKVELLNQLLPLFLTKTQINDKILPAIEKARSKWKDLLNQEDAIIAKFDAPLSETIKNALEKQEYPKRELLVDMKEKIRSMQMKRTVLSITLVDDLAGMLKETLDKGQMKAMLGSFAPQFVDPKAKPEELTEDTKRSFFIQNVFMDPATRELLIELAKTAK